MDKEEFESQYAQRSGVTVEWLHKYGRYGIPCDCGEDYCEGWQMIFVNKPLPESEWEAKEECERPEPIEHPYIIQESE